MDINGCILYMYTIIYMILYIESIWTSIVIDIVIDILIDSGLKWLTVIDNDS